MFYLVKQPAEMFSRDEAPSDWSRSPDSEELLMNSRVFNNLEFYLFQLKEHTT